MLPILSAIAPRVEPPHGGFTPWSLGGLLKIWFDADDPSVGAVTTWTDRAAGALAPTQGTAGSRPVQSATALNGFAGITFDGTDDNLLIASVGNIPTGTDDGWIFALVSQDILDTTARVIIGVGNSGASAGRTFNKNTTAAGRLAIGNNTVNINDAATIFSGIHIVAGHWLGGGLIEEGILDGVPTTPPMAVTASNTGTTRTTIGASDAGTGAFPWLGVMRHIVGTSAIPSRDVLKMFGYLAHDVLLAASLLPINHPYRFVRP